jgi:hypothetical protein
LAKSIHGEIGKLIFKHYLSKKVTQKPSIFILSFIKRGSIFQEEKRINTDGVALEYPTRLEHHIMFF